MQRYLAVGRLGEGVDLEHGAVALNEGFVHRLDLRTTFPSPLPPRRRSAAVHPVRIPSSSLELTATCSPPHHQHQHLLLGHASGFRAGELHLLGDRLGLSRREARPDVDGLLGCERREAAEVSSADPERRGAVHHAPSAVTRRWISRFKHPEMDLEIRGMKSVRAGASEIRGIFSRPQGQIWPDQSRVAPPGLPRHNCASAQASLGRGGACVRARGASWRSSRRAKHLDDGVGVCRGDVLDRHASRRAARGGVSSTKNPRTIRIMSGVWSLGDRARHLDSLSASGGQRQRTALWWWRGGCEEPLF